ncbi:PREDICTED: alpha-tocopherol transfer protein-like [Nicrophorus vespilloides]|uniref:Alpha-tocopherol transfer protein-like n=1 Tax=Nicrophorus vespilloides TaxID=110193 RepID=A0ABM1MR07_NICVS|nr:PREDICTED: alpha-tocopherol transfer protein-like [Nicrophorus vespilloides]
MPQDTDVLSELDLEDPPQELVAWAKKHLNEDPDTRLKVLDDFRNMIYNRGECVPHRTDDAFLLRFLRARYFQLERSHRLLVNYYNFKENNPEFVEDVNLKHLQRIGDDDIITVPPYREQNGRRILLYRIGIWDPKKFTITELFQATLVILELAILEQRAQILGGVCMFDLEGLSLQKSWHLTPSVASKIVQIMVTSFPMKIEAIHIVNQSWVFDMVFNVFRPFLDERMRKRLFFHGDDWESLHQHIDPKHLPERYGGVHPDYNHKDWMNYFFRTDKIIQEMESMGYKHDENEDETNSEK